MTFKQLLTCENQFNIFPVHKSLFTRYIQVYVTDTKCTCSMPFKQIRTSYGSDVPVIFMYDFSARQIDWIFIPNYAIHLADKTVIVSSTREDCLFTCEADPDCISIDYFKATRTCYHNMESILVPTPDVNYDYYYPCDEWRASPGESLVVALVTERFHHKALSVRKLREHIFSPDAATFDWQNLRWLSGWNDFCLALLLDNYLYLLSYCYFNHVPNVYRSRWLS